MGGRPGEAQQQSQARGVVPKAWRRRVEFRGLSESEENLRAHRGAIDEVRGRLQAHVASPFQRHERGILGHRRTRGDATVPAGKHPFAFHEPRHRPQVRHERSGVAFHGAKSAIEALEDRRVGLTGLHHRVDPLEERHPEREALVVRAQARVRRQRLYLGDNAGAAAGRHMEDRMHERLTRAGEPRTRLARAFRRGEVLGPRSVEERQATIGLAPVFPAQDDGLDRDVARIDDRF